VGVLPNPFWLGHEGHSCVADTILDALRRSIGTVEHPLTPVDCGLLAEHASAPVELADLVKGKREEASSTRKSPEPTEG